METEEAQCALNNMEGQYSVRPIPAFDVEGNLIRPDCYVQLLKGAMVAARFSLQKYLVKEKGCPARDVFVADIDALQVLLEGKIALCSTPKKRVWKKNPFEVGAAGKGKKVAKK